MARVLYGVHGSLHGHAMRALTLARHFSEHEFLFISYDQGASLLQAEFPVVEIPGPVTVYQNQRVALAPTVVRTLRHLAAYPWHLRQVLKVMEEFQPDVALADYDFLVPRACRRVGLPCLSVDHQHIITFCRHCLPWRQRLPQLQLSLVIRLLFSQASHYLVISFFRPPLKPGVRAWLAPPLLRDSVLARQPREDGHVLVYQSVTPFPGFFSFLKAIPHPVVVYGFHRNQREDNLVFKENSEAGFLEDLASCRYVICAGSHTLTSEALYYGKPVLALPCKGAFEQVLNTHYLEQLNYGLGLYRLPPWAGVLADFEARLEGFRASICRENFLGNDEVYARVEEFIREKGRVSW